VPRHKRIIPGGDIVSFSWHTGFLSGLVGRMFPDLSGRIPDCGGRVADLSAVLADCSGTVPDWR
jgi:hypothetical protein